MALQILVVEDDAASLELMSEVLRSPDTDIVALADPIEATRAIEARKFDGIFLDLTMPGMNGYQLTDVVRRSKWNRATPVIIVSGSVQQAAVADAFGVGATFFLPKPIDRGKLLKLFRTAQGAMLANQMRFSRMSFRTMVECRQTSGAIIKGESSNLSNGGLLFDAASSLAVGDHVQLSFALPGDRMPIRCQCVVARVDEDGRAGVRFTQIKQADQLKIRDVVLRFSAAAG